MKNEKNYNFSANNIFDIFRVQNVGFVFVFRYSLEKSLACFEGIQVTSEEHAKMCEKSLRGNQNCWLKICHIEKKCTEIEDSIVFATS